MNEEFEKFWEKEIVPGLVETFKEGAELFGMEDTPAMQKAYLGRWRKVARKLWDNYSPPLRVESSKRYWLAFASMFIMIAGALAFGIFTYLGVSISEFSSLDHILYGCIGTLLTLCFGAGALVMFFDLQLHKRK